MKKKYKSLILLLSVLFTFLMGNFLAVKAEVDNSIETGMLAGISTGYCITVILYKDKILK